MSEATYSHDVTHILQIVNALTFDPSVQEKKPCMFDIQKNTCIL